MALMGTNSIYNGNLFKRLDNLPDNVDPTQKNHVPSSQSYALAGFKITANDKKYLSAHLMQFGDHRNYITTGSDADAKAFRKLEASHIKSGNYEEAFDMNVRAIREEHGNKYDVGLEQAKQHYIKEVIPWLKKKKN